MKKFEKLDRSASGEVRFGDGSLVQIQGKGSIKIVCKNGETRILHNVYYIPTLRSNIISLGQLSEEGNRVVMNGEKLWVYESCGRMLMQVQRSANRLYKIHIQEAEHCCLLTKSEEEAWLWHKRLGHVNFRAMQLLSKNHMAYGVPSIVHPKDVCDGCLMSKQTRKSFPHQSNFTAKSVLELVHLDLCGPISPSTPGGKNYFMLLVDDFSRMMWIYLLRTKNEALSCFKKFKVFVEKGRSQGIRVLRTDRGGEFCSKEFNCFCEEHGILRHYTAPYTPQQNGVVERRNRTVVAMTRSMLKERQVPAQYWGEAITHAVYVLNKLPTRAVSSITPHEAWFGTKPDLTYVRIFGCTAYMKIPVVHTKKLDNRSQLVVHFGRESGTKAFRLFDPTTGHIHVSRDVVFTEHKAWNWDTTTESETSSGAHFTLENDPTEFETTREEEENANTPPHTPTTTSQSSHSETEDTGTSSDESEQPK